MLLQLISTNIYLKYFATVWTDIALFGMTNFSVLFVVGQVSEFLLAYITCVDSHVHFEYSIISLHVICTKIRRVCHLMLIQRLLAGK